MGAVDSVVTQRPLVLKEKRHIFVSIFLGGGDSLCMTCGSGDFQEVFSVFPQCIVCQSSPGNKQPDTCRVASWVMPSPQPPFMRAQIPKSEARSFGLGA